MIYIPFASVSGGVAYWSISDSCRMQVEICRVPVVLRVAKNYFMGFVLGCRPRKFFFSSLGRVAGWLKNGIFGFGSDKKPTRAWPYCQPHSKYGLSSSVFFVFGWLSEQSMFYHSILYQASNVFIKNCFTLNFVNPVLIFR